MKFKQVHTWAALFGIVALALAAWWWQNRPQAGALLDAGVAAKGAGGGPDGAPGRPGGAPVPGGPGGPGGPASVEVGKVESMTLEDDAQAVGSLRSRQGVVLRPEVSGRIAKLGFSDGQAVRRGQLLVQLDDTLQQAQLKQAQAQASIARTNLSRNRDLSGQGFVSPSAVDQSAAALEVAEAQVALAQAQLARMRILAPFDAVAGIRSVDLGDYVKDGADLVNIEDLSQVWLDFRLPERFIARVKPGQAVDVTLDAIPGRRFTGKIEALDSLIDANGRSLLVRARLDNPGGVLKSGLFARTRIVFSRRENAIVVPEEALVPQGGKQFVFKVLDGANGKVSQRIEAQIGQRLPGKVEILDGLAVGDWVVTAGQARLMRGDALPLKVVDLSNVGGARGAAQRPAGAASAAPAAAGASSASGAASARQPPA
ncbi:MAG TPA: efflux RND transporter periplasmic adaptor subunit [Rubrivivax sp.]|jgi:membrane fusion protein (multidrug efflux system)|nr:efflux RND transporter periplasmic adaptor subunit [Rubrivivax sp.]